MSTMDSRSPNKSLTSGSDDGNDRLTRSSNFKIKSRKSIKDSSPTGNQDSVSDSSSESDEVIDEYRKSPVATRKKIYPDLRDVSRELTHSPEKTKYKPNTRGKTPIPVKEEKTTSSIIWIIFAGLVIVAGMVLRNYSKEVSSKDQETPKFTIDCSRLIKLNEKFDNQDKKLFKSLQAGIEGMYSRTPQIPSVVTFFSMDEEAMNKVLSDVVEIAKQCINQSHDPISLTSADLNTREFAEDNRMIISKFKDKLKERKIMIINNVDEVQSSIVSSLHSFADTYNPLVSESILYLTVKVPMKPDNDHANYIYTYLQKQWPDLPSNVRDPLITRFLDQTFYIN